MDAIEIGSVSIGECCKKIINRTMECVFVDGGSVLFLVLNYSVYFVLSIGMCIGCLICVWFFYL